MASVKNCPARNKKTTTALHVEECVAAFVFHDEVSWFRYVGRLTRHLPSAHKDSSSPYFAGPAVSREGSDGTTLAREMLDRCPGCGR